MIDYIIENINDIKGNVLTVGVNNNKIIKKLLKNSNINLYGINKSQSNSFFRKSKRSLNNERSINIKKLHKVFNKKSIDYIICDVDEIDEYLKYFIKDTIYVNSNKLYIYGNKEDIDFENLIGRYKRYNVKINFFEFSDNFVLVIDNSKSKNKKIREKFYFIKDSLYDMVNFISNVLIS